MEDLDPMTELPEEGVAILGMSCRFPAVDGTEQFWRLLCAGGEAISRFSEEELRTAGVALPLPPDFVAAGSILEDEELFDAAFFDLNPREAELTDPQHRLFLECAWQALEIAGYDPDRCGARTGVFAGAALNTYAPCSIYPNREVRKAVDPLQLLVAVDKDFLATLVSYKLNLRGPSIGVQTACSSALVAVHLACQSLLTYQCDLALAGGVTVKVPKDRGYRWHEGAIVSRDGRCRPFDAAAAGTVFGSGLGAVVLKRLEDAVADGDPIEAVIRGTAINNDGAMKVGFTAPSVRGQAEVIAAAQELAEVGAEEIGYLETHGTGTALGDPVELAALEEVFRAGTNRKGYCALGAVKANIGHLDVAAGVAGLIKTALVLKHRQIPPLLHFEKPNPRIDLEASPFYAPTRLEEWRSEGPRRAGVSSFGVGGTNAHAVLEEAPALPPSGPSRRWQLLPLSARTETALEAATSRLATALEERRDAPLADVAYTLQVGRKVFRYRRAAVCRDPDDAVAVLRGGEPERIFTGHEESTRRAVAFLFPGQGTQYFGMGRELYGSEAVFRRELDRCAELLRPRLGEDLRGLLHSAAEPAAAATERLARTEVAQPALFAVEYALARLWMSWGVHPAAMIGHSIGEYVAACLAGVFELADALALVAARGQLMQRLPRGAMLSVPLGEEELAPLLGSGLSLAAVNGPASCVAAGPEEAVEELRARLLDDGMESRRLRTSRAFHSAMMEPIVGSFAALVERCPRKPPSLPFLANVTGTWIQPAEATDPAYWARHLRRTVRFDQGLRELLTEPDQVLLEVGPGRALGTLARAAEDRTAPGRVILSSLPPSREASAEPRHLAETLGRLWLAGVDVDWQGYYAAETRRRVSGLPTYPFERRRYWIEPATEAAAPVAGPTALRADLADWFSLPIWKPSMPLLAAGAERGGTWLVFSDRLGLGAGVIERLRAAAKRVVEVVPGEEFAPAGDDRYTLAAGRPEDYEALWRELEAGGRPVEILHLWSVTGGEVDAAAARELGFWSLLALGRALGEVGVDGPVRLGVVADGLWNPDGATRIEPEKATLLGACRVLPLEYPHLSCRVLDVAPPSPETRDLLIDQILDELGSAREEREVAWRGRRRWVPDLEPCRLEEAPAGIGRLRDRGVYWITGGLGGLGLQLAGHLARTVRARLVLSSRSGLPEREDWDEVLERQGTLAPLGRKILALRELEAAGAEVLVLAADVADGEQMRRGLARALERFGTIHGAIHAAGAAGSGPVQFTTRPAVEAVLAPKVEGTRNLASVLEGQPLDFLVLLSSTTSLTGGLGQADYCAANAFLDAFAQARSAEGKGYTVAINYDVWNEVGMAVTPPTVAPPAELSAAEDTAGEPADTAVAGDPEASAHPLLGEQVSGADGEVVVRARLGAAGSWVLDEHRILGQPVLPGTAILEMVRAAFARRGVGESVELRNVMFLSPLVVPDGGEREVQTVLTGHDRRVSFKVRSRARVAPGAAAGWQEHASGEVGALAEEAAVVSGIPELVGAAGPLTEAVGADHSLDDAVFWGPRWRRIGKGTLDDRYVRLELPDDLAPDLSSFSLHPALFDVATSLGTVGRGTYLPLAYKRVKIFRPLVPKILVGFRETADGGVAGQETLNLDVQILDRAGRELVVVEEFTLRKGHSPAPAAGGDGRWAHGIPSQKGCEALERILAQVTAPQVVVSARDLARPMAVDSAEGAGEAGGEVTSAPAAAHERPHLPNPYVAPRNDTEEAITNLLQEALGFDRVGIHDDFFELGGHSVLALQLISKLRETFGVDLPMNVLFEAPTVAELGEVVLREIGGGVEEADLLAALAELENLSEEEAKALLEVAEEEDHG